MTASGDEPDEELSKNDESTDTRSRPGLEAEGNGLGR